MLEHTIKLMGITDAKFTPSGGSAVDFYGIQELKISGEFTEKKVEGDDAVIGYFSKLDSAAVDFSHAALSLDALAALMNGTVTDAGTSPSQTATLQVLASSMPEGVFEAQGTLINHTTGDKVGDVHIKLQRLKINKVDIDTKTNDVAVVSFSAEAIPDDNKVLLEITFNETVTDIT